MVAMRNADTESLPMVLRANAMDASTKARRRRKSQLAGNPMSDSDRLALVREYLIGREFTADSYSDLCEIVGGIDA